ncbi:MAG TPA: Nif3-like dinuclear metal center hexameric protein [Puia sp.]|nr:Nif3-like dinuclear metal center hexameric protein [Puia sp.]
MQRRHFLAATAAALTTSSLRFTQAAAAPNNAMTVQQVIDALLADIPGAPFPNTVDTIKCGDRGQPVKGIVTTMFPTNEIVGKTIDLGANFIIAHEPTFYNHADETKWLSEDPVYRYKRNLLDKHGIAVWRFHDGIHAHKPDGIRMGVLQALGWDHYYNQDDPFLIELPAPIPLSQLLAHCKKSLDIAKLKFIGDPIQDCKRIVLSPGAAGGQRQITNIQKYQPDCFICGELNEWETSEYIRDARIQGRKISLIVTGHAVSEEPGMQWLVPVLKQKAPGIPVTHLPSGDPLSFY